LYALYKNPNFDNIVIMLIILSSLKLATDTYQDKFGAGVIEFMDKIDTVFNILFIFEMSIKIVAMGLCMDEGSYLRESWN